MSTVYETLKTLKHGDNDKHRLFLRKIWIDEHSGFTSSEKFLLNEYIDLLVQLIDTVPVVPIEVKIDIEYLIPVHHKIVIPEFPTFDTYQEAIQWMEDEVDDPYIDNERFAFCDDHEATLKYEAQIESGCCGSFDRKVSINGRLGLIGCNYGH